jgi:hypothetical protein
VQLPETAQLWRWSAAPTHCRFHCHQYELEYRHEEDFYQDQADAAAVAETERYMAEVAALRLFERSEWGTQTDASEILVPETQPSQPAQQEDSFPTEITAVAPTWIKAPHACSHAMWQRAWTTTKKQLEKMGDFDKDWPNTDDRYLCAWEEAWQLALQWAQVAQPEPLCFKFVGTSFTPLFVGADQA